MDAELLVAAGRLAERLGWPEPVVESVARLGDETDWFAADSAGRG